MEDGCDWMDKPAPLSSSPSSSLGGLSCQTGLSPVNHCLLLPPSQCCPEPKVEPISLGWQVPRPGLHRETPLPPVCQRIASGKFRFGVPRAAPPTEWARTSRSQVLPPGMAQVCPGQGQYLLGFLPVAAVWTPSAAHCSDHHQNSEDPVCIVEPGAVRKRVQHGPCAMRIPGAM